MGSFRSTRRWRRPFKRLSPSICSARKATIGTPSREESTRLPFDAVSGQGVAAVGEGGRERMRIAKRSPTHHHHYHHHHHHHRSANYPNHDTKPQGSERRALRA